MTSCLLVRFTCEPELSTALLQDACTESRDGKNSPGANNSGDWRKETCRGSGWDAVGLVRGLKAAFPGFRMPIGWNATYEDARARYLASSQALLGAPI